MLPVSFSLIILFLYAGAWLRLHLALRNDTRINANMQMLLAGLGGLGQTLLTWSSMSVETGVDFSLFKVLSLIAGLTVAAVAFSSRRTAVQPVQLIFIPLAALMLAGELMTAGSATPLALSPGTATHVLLSLVAFGIFTLATVLALLLGYAESRLKHHRVTSLVRHIPPIEALESFIFELLTLGSLLLAGSVVSGFIYLDDIFAQHLVHKTALSIVALAVFSLLSIGHWVQGWRGKRIMRGVVFAYLMLSLGFVGSKMVLEWILG